MILIWGSDRAKFGTPETKYKDERVCVTGKITGYRGKPEVIATEQSQIVQQN
jgi:DNA/RNA endonuclease YhcR with UshA esterase domain